MESVENLFNIREYLGTMWTIGQLAEILLIHGYQ